MYRDTVIQGEKQRKGDGEREVKNTEKHSHRTARTAKTMTKRKERKMVIPKAERELGLAERGPHSCRVPPV